MSEILSFSDTLENNSENTKEMIDKISIERLQTMKNSDFLKIEPENRLQYITKNEVKSENIKNKTDDFIEFNFTYKWIYNRELWVKTTAWQVLPNEVKEVECKWIFYSRDWLKWEFFSDTNSRFVIDQNTKVNISKLWDISWLEKENNNLISKYLEENSEKKIFADVVEEAVNRWIDIDFAIMFFWEKVKNINILDRKAPLEDIFTEFDRLRPGISFYNWWLLDDWKYPDELVLKLIKKLNLDFWLAKDYWIDIQVLDNFKHKKHSADYLSLSEQNRIISIAPEYVKNLVKKYFPVEEYENALLVCNWASSFKERAINYNTDSNSSADRWLFQINDYWHSNKYKWQDIYDPEINVKIAAQIFKEAGNSWRPWYAARKIGLA